MSRYRSIGERMSDAHLAHGLYDPRFEHDACGIAFVASTAGERSHRIVSLALQALVNLGHRGACGADEDSGDGAGVLLQIPDRFLRRSSGIPLPAPGRYGAGLLFLPADSALQRRCAAIVEATCRDEGMQILGWREVPVDPDVLGGAAREALPCIRQVFVAAIGLAGDVLERRLYVVRRAIENSAAAAGLTRRQLHIASLSSRTLVYKGMLTAAQLAPFFADLRDPDVASSLALVHARFSTNVLPRWDLAQPFRMSAHNGEINTLRGNANWMRARQSKFRSPLFGDDIAKLRPVLDEEGSDSAQFDNALELLAMSGRSVEHAMVMMIPEAWHENRLMDPERRAFYEFHASLLEPWDGPAAIAFSDGRVIGATLDRNGLRPARYLTSRDGLVVMASEAGVLDIPDDNITHKWRLEPGRLLLVDTEAGRILGDAACKSVLASAYPYREWIRAGTVHLHELDAPEQPPLPDPGTLLVRQQAFGYSEEDVDMILAPTVQAHEEPVGSMGNDTPLAVLSERPLPLFVYFKQLFAQVTNPPIDPIREQTVMSLVSSLGSGGNLLEQGPAQAKRLEIPHPVLTNADLEKIRHVTQRAFPSATISMTFNREAGSAGLVEGIDRLCRLASERIAEGCSVLVLSDRHIDSAHVPIPSLLATAAVHHHLVAEQSRTGVGMVVETGEAREVMHLALLVGFGAEALNPYLAFETLHDLARRGRLPRGVDGDRAEALYVEALTKGLRKVIAKMGISTVLSYCGAQIFEAVGIDRAVIDRYFPGTPSRIEGIGIDVIAREAIARHRLAFPEHRVTAPRLEDRAEYRWRRGGEHHQWNPEVIARLQHAVKAHDEAAYREYAAMVDTPGGHSPADAPMGATAAPPPESRTLRSLFEFDTSRGPIPLDAVEPAEEIVRRFATGAMSLGSISKEMHETLAIAMNRIGGRSNTGEGGEDPDRHRRDRNGDWRRSAIKQVASARFGVNADYLVNADELQIKIAQGAKPGEGGQLPGSKVDGYIARLRHSTPGVGLISPPPHHDIYSIEDLAQLIWDLRCVNPGARISVKLAAEVGVGTVAAGVAKARADSIVIAGYEGGTGASPLSSIKHAGTPWELGLAEAQQVLVAQALRSRVRLQADGQLKTGRDVVVAALLGADEFGFATAPLVAAGCVMMRVCHLNTCPVGIATQDPLLRRRFAGRPEHIVTFMHFVAEDVRRWMAALGFARFEDMIGRAEVLRPRSALSHWKARRVDLTALLQTREESAATRYVESRDTRIVDCVDLDVLDECRPAFDHGQPVRVRRAVRNAHRSIGALLSGEVARRHGAEGLPEGTIRLDLEGCAGQSLGAWLARGITVHLCGETNDYAGKGLSGGTIVVRPPPGERRAQSNIIAGNVALYGATAGEAYFRGVVGERFAVRNSGAVAVVEGLGDHGCEYMTGGTVLVIGRTGRNFAAGMSGGTALVFDEDGRFPERCDAATVELEELEHPEDIALARRLLERHTELTDSDVARRILHSWRRSIARFVKVMPVEYREAIARRQAVQPQRLELVS
jgi:glutamate synthase (NADPH) large chain